MSHLFTRLLWLAFGAGIGAYQLWLGLSTRHPGISLCGVGFMLLGAAWFLHPLPLTSPVQRSTLTSTATAVGPQHVRTVLTGTAFLCLVIGMLLRYGFGI